MRRVIRLLILFLLLLMIAGVVLSLMRTAITRHYLSGIKPPVLSVAVAKAELRRWQMRVGAVGTVVAVKGVSIQPQVSGKITHIGFASGQLVKKGDFLVQLDDRLDQQSVVAASARLVLAQASYHRIQSLYSSHAISKNDFEKARSQWQQASAALETARIGVAHKHIVAPFAGRLGLRQVNVGQYIMPSTIIAQLQSQGQLHVDFSLPQRYLSFIKMGQKVQSTVDSYKKHVFMGRITAVDATVNQDNRMIRVQATVKDPQHMLLPGLFVDVKVFDQKWQSVLTVPKTAVAYSLYGDSVFVVKSSAAPQATYTVVQKNITLGRDMGDWVEVMKGLQVGDLVVSQGEHKLYSGMSVSITDKVQLHPKPASQLEGGA